MYICICVYMYGRIYVFMYICIHVCIHPHSCVKDTCMGRPYHTRVYTHTHTHTYSLFVSLIKESNLCAAILMATRTTRRITHKCTRTHTHTFSLSLSLRLSLIRVSSLFPAALCSSCDHQELHIELLSIRLS